MASRGMVIVGAGECGVRAAFALREAGYAGPVTLVGEEAALPYERPPLSKGSSAVPKLIAEEHRYEEAGIRFLRGTRVNGVDRESKTVDIADGPAIRYQRLLIATGARPRPLPGLPFDGDRVLSLRNHEDALALQRWMTAGRKIAIIGGGFIGLELAATFRQAGADVTLIEVLPRILMRGVPERLAALLHERHVSEGVTFHCGLAISTVSRTAESVSVLLADDTVIDADILIVGIGAIPNTALAEAAGLAIDNGIIVDPHLQTTDPDIFAAGDCCNFPLSVYDSRRVRLESWRSAQEQGALAAANMLGTPTPLSAVPWFWSDQYDLTLLVAGLADGASGTVERRQDDGSVILFHLSDDGRLLAASGLGTGNAVARDIRLAEMLVAAGARPDPATLADPTLKLKSLLRAA
jgi:3-phenylpropionate/trans-cinnamate dioxygenase ferredoxin reductase subunit